MNSSLPSSRLQQLYPLADAVVIGAHEAQKAAVKLWKRGRRRKRGQVLRPGESTPLWNELARQVELALTRRGDKARLAQMLGISRQKVHVLIVAKTACPDAERTLLLLAWLRSRSTLGQDQRPFPSAPVA
jgi:hypothetical protein